MREKFAGKVRLLKSKIKSSLMTALSVLKGVDFERRWWTRCPLLGRLLALFLHSPSRSRKSSNSKSLITITLQILEILAIHLSPFFNIICFKRNYISSDRFEKVHGNSNRCWRITAHVKEYVEDFIQRWNSSYGYR